MPPEAAGEPIADPVRIKVWDVPTRLFHWALVLLIPLSYVSVETNRMELHFLSGYAILALLLFRLAWGIFGSDTARFARFVRTPLEGLRHLAAFLERGPDSEVGHNAAGGWMVLVMLGLLLVQTLTGLGSNDDFLNEGPLAKHLGKALSDRISVVHAINFKLILAAIVCHILAIAAYAVFRRHNLVMPMISGWTRLDRVVEAPKLRNPILALALLAVAGGLVWLVATRV
jgi:cytochrome b